MLRVFSMWVGEEEAVEKKWTAYLSIERIREADRRRSEKDRKLFLTAEVLLNRSLEAAGIPIALPAVYARNPHGKPYLLSTDQIYVNWSHSGDWVLCALADQEVGIDLQETKKEPKEALIRRILQPEEQRFYQAAPEEQKQLLFYQYWTVKESYLKALGTGFHTSLDHFYVEMDGMFPKIIQRNKSRDYHCQLLDTKRDDYVAAVCVERSEEQYDARVVIEVL